MKYFNFITENAYVQEGEYKVKHYHRPGQHFLQRVPGMGTPGVEVSTSVPYTADAAGLHRLSVLVENGAGTDRALVNVTIQNDDGTKVVHSEFVGVDATDPTTEIIEFVTWLEADEVLAVALEDGETPSIESARIVLTTEESLPESFSADWAVFVDGHDDVRGYNAGMYGIGVKPSTTVITVPRVKKVSLLYLMSDKSTQEQKTLVQFDGDLDDLKALGLVGAGGERITFTEEEFIEKFAGQGFNRFGRILPQGMAYSTVSELASFTGDFVGEDGKAAANLTVYFEPMYMYNERPLFDYVYLQAGFAGEFGAWAGISGYFLRWLGANPSETIAPINRIGDPIYKDGYLYDLENQQVTTPQDGAFPGDNDVTYVNADQYNVRNFRRR